MVFPLIAAAFSAVVSVVSSIGPAVAGFCANVLPKLGPLLAQGLDALKLVGQIADTVAHIMGIFKEHESVEDMGDRAIQAAEQGVTPDQFNDHAEYVDTLRNFELDEEKSAKTSPMQKIVSGLAVASAALDEKLNTPEGTAGGLWVLAGANPDYFNADRLTQFLKTGQDIRSIVDYFEGKMGGAESLDVEDELVALDKAAAPEKDEQSIRAQIYGAADSVQNPSHP